MDSDAIKQHIRGIFDRAAPTYGQVGARFFQEFGRRLVGVAGVATGSRVLDVATGRGAVLFPAAAAAGPSGRVVGIDLAPGMVAATAAEARARGVDNVELRAMDAEELDFSDDSFDAVLCGFALFMMPHMDQALAEMRRVLRPGGRVAVSSWVDVWGPEFSWLEPLQIQYLPLAQAPARSADGTQPVFDTPDGLGAILSGAGFTDVRIVADAVRFVYADEQAWWQSMWSHGMRGWLEGLERQQGSTALRQFQQAACAELRAHRAADGFPQTSSVLFGVAVRAG